MPATVGRCPWPDPANIPAQAECTHAPTGSQGSRSRWQGPRGPPCTVWQAARGPRRHVFGRWWAAGTGRTERTGQALCRGVKGMPRIRKTAASGGDRSVRPTLAAPMQSACPHPTRPSQQIDSSSPHRLRQMAGGHPRRTGPDRDLAPLDAGLWSAGVRLASGHLIRAGGCHRGESVRPECLRMPRPRHRRAARRRPNSRRAPPL